MSITALIQKLQMKPNFLKQYLQMGSLTHDAVSMVTCEEKKGRIKINYMFFLIAYNQGTFPESFMVISQIIKKIQCEMCY